MKFHVVFDKYYCSGESDSDKYQVYDWKYDSLNNKITFTLDTFMSNQMRIFRDEIFVELQNKFQVKGKRERVLYVANIFEYNKITCIMMDNYVKDIVSVQERDENNVDFASFYEFVFFDRKTNKFSHVAKLQNYSFLGDSFLNDGTILTDRDEDHVSIYCIEDQSKELYKLYKPPRLLSYDYYHFKWEKMNDMIYSTCHLKRQITFYGIGSNTNKYYEIGSFDFSSYGSCVDHMDHLGQCIYIIVGNGTGYSGKLIIYDTKTKTHSIDYSYNKFYGMTKFGNVLVILKLLIIMIHMVRILRIWNM